MGQLAQVAQNNQLTHARPDDNIRRLLANNWDKISAVMPKHMSSERLFQLAVSSINQTPKLAECDAMSLCSCVMKCSALGLEPSAVDGLGMAYVLPYRNHGKMQAQFILGYKGIIELCRRSGQLKSIHAQAVYEGDEYTHWEDEGGQHFKFVANKDAEHTESKLTDVYMCAQLMGGGFVFETMTKKEVDAIRKRSKAASSGFSPWSTDYEAMALKTVIRHAAKYLPVSVEAKTAVAEDENTPDYSGIFKPVIVDADGVIQEPQEAAVAAETPYISHESKDVPEEAELYETDQEF
ncbi:recombinase RecT [uncultured Olegusella sp.]|uniref:recombinase RecT n=1 Tax=uncultured Olegusella sp. TaxID=1979846 RepID=UPI00261E2022|nr:recombinase RecT [uncultured Olegusella sp.]